jgi:F0F1-type ATP synthase assembly protein I
MYNWRGLEEVPIKQLKDTVVPVALIIRLGAIVVGGILGTLALGILIDKLFGISPCGLLLFMFIGIIVSIIGVYRAVQDTYDNILPPEEGRK